ncbi:MAG TPA: ribosome recycling factor [Candidatus Saccharimonadales bacterium]|nr:ribosome recycling factor [Candidatus Saccharimonadales bacterium]
MDQLLQDTRHHMQKALDVLRDDMNTIRTGKASPSLVENLVIAVYGGSTKLKVMELATVSAADQTLLVTPFDPSIANEIQKGIQDANTGLSPVVDGPLIRITLPPLSQERREQLIHLMKQKLENGKILIRQARHEAMTELKKAEASEDEERRLEKEIQKITDDFISNIDSMGKQKEQELMQI